jgi:hypothetical protein
MKRLPAILAATAIAGTLDMLDVLVFYGLRGVPLIRMPQSVATGLLGTEAYQGGAATAVLGLALHYAILFVAAAVFFELVQRLQRLRRSWLLNTVIFGVGMYGVMNFVVLPLSAARPSAHHGLVLANLLFAHIVLCGGPIAWFAMRAARPASSAIAV